MRNARALRGVLFCLLLLAGCQQRAGPEDPVFSAIRNNDAQTLGQFLADGGDPNLANSQGDSLLYVATGPRGGLDVVQALLMAGADAGKASSEGRTPLHNAVGWCEPAIVSALLDAGADPDAESANGKTPADGVCAEPEDRRHDVLSLLSGVGG